MAKVIIMIHPHYKLICKGYIGFSWTYLFFGHLVPFIRGEIGISLMHLMLMLLTAVSTALNTDNPSIGIPFTSIAYFTVQIILSFIYNRQHMIRLFEKGYILHDSQSLTERTQHDLGLIIKLTQ